VKLPERFVFSQSSLQAYTSCPRRFQLRYVLGLKWPVARVDSSLDWERRARLGEVFHRLVQQHLLGIEPVKLRAVAEQAGLTQSWDAYIASPPHDIPGTRWVELGLRVPVGGYVLSARYDLVAIEAAQRAVIVDWKTATRLPGRTQLAARMQTLVYRYVLAEAGAQVNGGERLAPEQIELLYWFAGQPGQQTRLTYDAAEHAAAGQRIRSLVAEITGVDAPNWPQAPQASACSGCPYQTLCGREAGLLAEAETEDELDAELVMPDLEQIAEIAF
jgi:CRISPR/Cas system-associated exonuclease Cas4 (RecB family)